MTRHRGNVEGARTARLAESILIFVIGVALMHFIQTGTWGPAAGEPGVPGHDSFYHIKMAQMFPDVGILREFPWLRFCDFTDRPGEFVSQHHGFHLLLAPFVSVSEKLTGDGLAGGRWAMAVCFGLNLMLINLFLRAHHVPWRWVWLFVFVIMPFQFFTRHAFVRAIGPSLTGMLLTLLVMLRGRAALTGLCIAGYTQLYLGGVIFAPCLVIAYALASIVGPRGERAFPWRIVAWAFGGWLLGVLLHPYSGSLYEWLVLQVFGTGLSPDIAVGQEWSPYNNTWWFAQLIGGITLVWIVALCVRLRFGPRLNAAEFTLLLLNFGFLVLTLKARRFIEYWPVLCLLSAALLIAPPLQDLRKMMARGHGWPPRIHRLWIRRGGAVLCLVAVLAFAHFSPVWHQIRNAARCGYDLPAIRKMMAFLETESEPGDVIFTDDWDIFPVYFYYNSRNYYVVGLDPKLTHERNPLLWERFAKISRGQAPTTTHVKTRNEDGEEVEKKISVAYSDIRDHFGAKYVIIDNEHQRFARNLHKAKDVAELIYPTNSYAQSKDAPYLVFRVKPKVPA